MADHMAEDAPARAYNMGEMEQAILDLQQEVLRLRAAAATVEQDVNRHVHQLMGQHIAGMAQPVPGVPAAPAALGRARANAPDEWTGEPRDIPLNDWWAQLQTYFECTGTDDPRQQVLVAAGCLRGAAGTWWRSRYEEMISAGRAVPATVQELINDLRTQFGRIYQNVDFRREWTQLRQGGKSVAEYTHRFKQVVMQIEDTNDGEILFRYIEGLNSRLKVRVEIERPATFERAIELAAAWEGPMNYHDHTQRRRSPRREGGSRYRRGDKRRSRSKGRSYRDERTRYPHYYDRNRNYSRGDAMELGQRTTRVRFEDERSGSRGKPRSNSRPKTPMRNTRNYGRSSSAGRTRVDIGKRAETRECYKCGRVGHLAADCRQKN